jgi:hypothetical protein
MSRSIKLLVVMSLIIVAIVPVAAFGATSLFVDVPDDSPFVNDINWMKANGVTKGCNPPTNTMYCPKNNVTREQMAAFMKRLAINKVVDAKTAVTANSAANADKLDGMDSTAFKSVAASASMAPTNVGNPPTVLGSVTGFDVPVAGGGILASAAVTVLGSGPQFGFFWIEIDGTGTCDPTVIPVPGMAVWESLDDPFDSVPVQASAAVSAGSHRVDLCHSGGGGLFPADMFGKLLVEWVPSVDNFGLLEADKTGATLEELLAQYADLLDN